MPDQDDTLSDRSIAKVGWVYQQPSSENNNCIGTAIKPLSSDTTTEGTVSPDSVTFTTGNWNAAQTVTVTGVDDGSGASGAVTSYNIVTGKAVSAADTTGYKNYDPADVSCTNTMPSPPPPTP